VTTLLIDSDILAYRESARGEIRVDWDGDGDVDQIAEPLEAIQQKVDASIAALVHKLSASRVIVCLSCAREDNWRKDVYPAYKENRAGQSKPLHLMAAKEYMRREYETYERARLEADDVMGILSTHPKLVTGRRIIVSEDKDMKTVPGWLFNPDKDKVPRIVDLVEADRWHMMQTLMGDPTDGYPGAPGIGPTKAEAALEGLETHAEMWPAVLRVYESRMPALAMTHASLVHEAALVQARIARICRYTDYNFQTKEVILWQPPSI
jgi:DNA polymerase-1